MPWAQVLPEHLAGWERSVPRERLVRRVPLVLGELVVQLVRSVPTEQKVHLARAQPVLRVQRVRLVVLERLVLSVQVLPGRSVG